MIALAGMMYFNPERALGAPQREGEWCRWKNAIIPVMLEKEPRWEVVCYEKGLDGRASASMGGTLCR
jgi:hypothetical protein